MRNQFFVHPIIIHASSRSPRIKELKECLQRYDRCILDGRCTIKCFYNILKEKVELLNKRFPKSKPLKVHKYSFPRHRHWYFSVRYADDINDLFSIHIDQIENIYFNISL